MSSLERKLMSHQITALMGKIANIKYELWLAEESVKILEFKEKEALRELEEEHNQALLMRLAAGEISRTTYLRKKEDLAPEPTAPTTPTEWTEANLKNLAHSKHSARGIDYGVLDQMRTR